MPTSSVSDTAVPPALPPADDHGVRVTVVAAYTPDDSDPAGGRHVFRYNVTITNDGDAPATLLSRRWVIIDANGKRQDVEGPGVVGQTPRIEPNHSHHYQSFCPLATAWGTMEGSYHMRRDDGAEFDVAIPRFVLRSA